MVFSDPRLAAYTGDRPYVFLSYSHKDGEEAGEVIGKLKDMGLRVWYDEGLSPGEVFSKALALRILNSGCFIGLMSDNYLGSDNCMNELAYALDHKKHCILIYLEDASIDEGVELQTKRLHALHKYKDGDRIYEKLLLSEELKQCLREPGEVEEAPSPQPPAPSPDDQTAVADPAGGRKKLLPAAAILCAAIILLAAVFFLLRSFTGKGDKAGATPDPSAASARVGESSLSYGAILSGETFIYDSEQFANSSEYYAAAEKRPAFGLTVQRCEVEHLIFLPDSGERPGDARDISQEGDGSVWAWVERRDDLYTLTVAADGGMRLPENAFGTFAGYSRLESVSWNDAVSFADVREARFLFADCGSLTALELKGLCSPTTLRAAFTGCSSLETLDLSGLSTENTTDISYLFSSCSRLKELRFDPEKFRTENVEYMEAVFRGCSALTHLDLSGFDTAKVKNFHNMFSGCSSLVSLTLDPLRFRTDSATTLRGMFEFCSGLTRLDLSGFDTARVTDMSFLFNGCSALTVLTLDPEKFYTGKVTDMSCMFQNCAGLTELDITCFNTVAVTDMAWMFKGCSGLLSLRWDPETFRTGKVTDMHAMFCQCAGLTELDLSCFSTAAVTDMSYMFSSCGGLKTIRWDPEAFRTDLVTNMYGMFNGCTQLTGLDLSTFAMEGVENTDFLLSECSGLRSVTFTTPVRLGEKMFNGSAVEELHLREGITGAAENAFTGAELRVYYSARQLPELADVLGQALGGAAEWILEDRVLSGSPGLDGTDCGALFDGDSHTVWRADMGEEPTVEWYEPEPLRVTDILLRYTISSETDTESLPAAWMLFGKSAAEGEWKLLLTQHRNTTWTVDGTGDKVRRILYHYTSGGVNTPYSELPECQYFRLVFSETFKEDSPVLQLGEFELEDNEADYTAWFESQEDQGE